MLTLDQIKKEYNEEIFRRNTKAVLVEYLQHELLDSIFKQKGSEKLSFIGGTAIRIVYGSQRFSEDLDFDNFGLSFSDFGKLLEKVVKDMEYKGFNLNFRLVEKGAYHCYIKFPDLLYENKISDYADEKILVRIDAVRKLKSFEPSIFVLNKFDIYRKILVNPVETILSQKLVAIIDRKREKGRDFYDVSFLLGKTNPDYDYLKKEKNCKNKEDLKKLVLEKIENLKMEKLAQEVSPFLMNPDDKERVLSFRQYIEQKL